MTGNFQKPLSLWIFGSAWIGLIILIGGIGYSVNGYVGFVLADGVMLAIAIRAWIVRKKLVHETPSPEMLATLSQFSAMSRLMSKVVAAALLVFLIYAAILTVVYTLPVAASWMNLFQPLADWLSEIIPALRRPAATGDAASWKQATQHILMSGWVIWAVFAAWICFSVFVADPNVWPKVLFLRSKKRTLAMALAALICCALFGVVFYFNPVPHRGLIAGPLRLISLAFIFSVTVLIFWAFAIAISTFWASLSAEREANAKAQ